MESIQVHVDRGPRGTWEISLVGPKERVSCETLEDARRVAHVHAAHRRPCELIVRDAYHRVVEHEFIGGHSNEDYARPDPTRADGCS